MVKLTIEDYCCLVNPWHCPGESITVGSDEVTHDSDRYAEPFDAPRLKQGLSLDPLIHLSSPANNLSECGLVVRKHEFSQMEYFVRSSISLRWEAFARCFDVPNSILKSIPSHVSMLELRTTEVD